MKVYEKDVEKLLKGIMQDLSKAKQYSSIQWKDEKNKRNTR